MLLAKFLSDYYASAYIKAFKSMTSALELLEPIEHSESHVRFVDADQD